MNHKGYVFYDGKSLIDNSSIIGIATLNSANKKTGNMIQTWILSKDINPIENLLGGDYGICGDCRHRPSNNGSCYVVVGQAPNNIWKSYQRGIYSNKINDFHISLKDRPIRLGAYGDPTAIPFSCWKSFLSQASSHTGYTHRWRECEEEFKSILMASVDSLEEKKEASGLGWRTFRIISSELEIKPREFLCPASEEKGFITTCEKCKACDGNKRGLTKASPAIIIHGRKKNEFIKLSKFNSSRGENSKSFSISA